MYYGNCSAAGIRRKEVSVNSNEWGSYLRPSETPIPVLLQVFNSVIDASVTKRFNDEMDESHMDEHDDNEVEMTTLRDEVVRVTAERDDAIRSREHAPSEMEEGWTLSSCDGHNPLENWFESEEVDAFLKAKDNTERAQMFLDVCDAIWPHAKPPKGKIYFSMGDTIYRKCDFEPREGYFNHATHKKFRVRPEIKGDIAVYRVTSTQVWESDVGNEYL